MILTWSHRLAWTQARALSLLCLARTSLSRLWISFLQTPAPVLVPDPARWFTYYSALYAAPAPLPALLLGLLVAPAASLALCPLTAPFILSELLSALHSLKSRKAADVNGLRAEFLRSSLICMLRFIKSSMMLLPLPLSHLPGALESSALFSSRAVTQLPVTVIVVLLFSCFGSKYFLCSFSAASILTYLLILSALPTSVPFSGVARPSITPIPSKRSFLMPALNLAPS